MKKRDILKYSLLFIVAACLASAGYAQDIHFSQFFNSPLNLNPASAGQFDGDYRFVGNHKQQWRSFEDAYSTFSVSVDRAFYQDKVLKPAIGLLFNNDVAGDGDLGSMHIALPLAASYQWEKMIFRLGLSPTFVQHGLNYSALTFGNQYDGDQYDPTLPSNEIPSLERFSYFDLAGGIGLDYRYNDSISFYFGASANHLMAPQKTFYSNPNVVLNLRWQWYVTANIQLTDDIFAQPAMFFMNQGTYREFNMGSNFRFDFNPLGLRSVYAGVYMRARDAGILMFGMDYNQIIMQISYDVNFSGLRVISNGRGGVELSLIYIFKQTKIQNIPPIRKCPDFI